MSYSIKKFKMYDVNLVKKLIIGALSTIAAYTFAKDSGWLPKKDVRGKHIFLTGAGSGIGQLMAISFAKLGAKLTLADINEKGLQSTKDQIKNEKNILLQKLDVSNRQ